MEQQEGPRTSAGVASIELIQSITKCIQETKRIARDVPVSKSNFLMLVFYLGELQPLVDDVNKEDQQLLNSLPLWTALNRLEGAANAVHLFTKTCTSRSRIFLLYRVENLVQEIRCLFKDVANCLSIIPEAPSLPTALKEGFQDLKAKMETAGFYTEPSHLQIAREIAEGVAAHKNNKNHGNEQQFATSLLKKIAEALAVPVPAAAELKLELQRDLETVECDPESPKLQELRDLCDLLNPAAVLADVRRLAFQENGLTRYGSLSINSSFICPITGQVMRDPVMVVEAGFTYEKEAICEWFNRGHRTCPDTGKELESLELVPNSNLREAIEEFSDRASRGELTGAIDTIREKETAAGTSSKSMSEDDEIREAVETIKSLSDTNPKYRRLIASMDGIQPLVGIVKKQKEKMPNVWDKVLRVLVSIAAIGDEYRILTVQAGVIPTLIRHLWKIDGENPLAMQLLLEVSKVEEGVSGIIESEKSIVCIVHATGSHIADIRALATKILTNLCHNRREVAIKVAGYQVFGPLVTILSSDESLESRGAMARAVVDLDLNEEGYTSLLQSGVVPPLLDLLRSEPEGDETSAAAKALQHLSSVEMCKVPICQAGAIPALVHFISSEDENIRLAVLGTLANLATDHQGAMEIDQEGAALRLLTMVRSPEDLPTAMQEYTLKTLECMARESKTVRSAVKDNDGGPYLVSLLQVDGLTAPSRASVLNLLTHLAEDRDNRDCVTISSNEDVSMLIGHLNQTAGAGSESTLSSQQEQEAIIGIFAGLAKVPERNQLLLRHPTFLEVLVKFLERGSMKTQELSALALSKLLESSEATIKDHQLVARQGSIPSLDALVCRGSLQGKCSAAVVLGLLSRFSPDLTETLTLGQKVAGFLGVKKFKSCRVHAGKCSPKKTLCLVESGAATHLIKLFAEKEARTAERALDALCTLIEDERNSSRGIYFLVKNNMIPELIGNFGKAPALTEKSVKLIERIFRDRRFREEKYYAGAQHALFKIIATGKGNTRKAAAQALEHVGLFSKGSTYTT